MSPRVRYRDVDFRPATLRVIEQAVEIARAYVVEGDSLTLRQLYYRFVAADLLPNRQSEYDRLGSIITDARYAGLFDWNWITDRTRGVRGGDGNMDDPIDVIEPLAYYTALWQGQRERVEVWVEKDALVDVVGRAAGPFRVPYFSCRGYTSASEVWAAARRIEGYVDEGVEKVTILHLGDHDPSGIDMSRDVETRIVDFIVGDGYLDRFDFYLERIALNMDQVDDYGPPPNPAKLTDSRSGEYIRRFGSESWELDALEPRVLRALITANIERHVDAAMLRERTRLEADGRKTLEAVRDHFADVREHLVENGWLIPPTDEEIELGDDDAEGE